MERAERSVSLPWLRGFEQVPPRLQALAAEAAKAPRSAGCTYRAASAAEELEAIAGWCQGLVQAQPAARILVLLPGAQGPRERLAALIREALDPAAVLDPQRRPRALAAVEGGGPLTELSLIGHALLSLRIATGEEVEFGQLAAWLRAPHWHSPAASARAALTLLWRERPVASLTVRELVGALRLAPPRLAAAAADLAARLAQAQAALGGSPATPRSWAERSMSALTALGLATGGEADSDAQQVLLRWHELLEEFGELSACVPRLAARHAIALLHEFAGGSTWTAPHEDPVVTIAAGLVDPVVIYDGIWVAGLSAQVLPQALQPDPFLPLAAQVAAGVPGASAAARAAQAQSLLHSWRAAGDALVLSVPARTQDLELLPSPLLAGLPLLSGVAGHHWLASSLHRDALTEAIEDPRGDAWDVSDTVPGGTRAVTLQSQCPFRAYAELRLGSLPPQTAEPGIPADQRGLLLHGALQYLWERLKDSDTLAGLAPAALAARIQESVAQAARAMLALNTGRRRRGRRAAEGQFDLFVQLPAVLERECRRAEQLILRLCELEKTRPPFSVVGTEQAADLNVAGARLRMRLDRVDLLAEGRVILDYKSGKAGTPDWYGERPGQPQLLAYLAALGADVVALATVHVTARRVHYSGVAAQEGLLPKVRSPRAGAPEWPELQQQWRALIENLILAFIAGDARVDPAPGACRYCHVIDICRILERSDGAEIALAEDEDE